MEYRENKALDVRTSLLGFGCMRLPAEESGQIREAEATAMLRRALEAGVNYVDTAHYYMSGQSEGFVGRALKGVPRDRYYLATKLPTWKVESLADAQAIFDLQLDRLQSDYIDFYLLHSLDRKRWDKMLDLGIVEWCEGLQREGKIRRLGFSFHDEYPVFERILTHRAWDFCQIQLNYLDTEEQAGLRGYRLAERLGVPLVIMEPVKGGALACLPEDLEANLRRARPDRSAASWALRWVAGLPNVLTVLSGMSTPEQVEDNLNTFRSFQRLDEEETALVERTARELHLRRKNGCTGCEYCMPCPAGVDIPEHFSLWNRMAQCKDGSLVWKDWNAGFKAEAKADHCVGCGKCEALCPQHIPIRAHLAQAKSDLDAIPNPTGTL